MTADIENRPTGPARSRPLFLATAGAAATVDLASKLWASAALEDRSIDLPGPVDLKLAHNRGIAFSAFSDAPLSLILAVTGAIVVVLVVLAWRGTLPPIAAGLIVGGAAGNVLDRMQGGSVVDVLHTGWWPTFNLADVMLNVGVGLVLLGEVRGRDRLNP